MEILITLYGAGQLFGLSGDFTIVSACVLSVINTISINSQQK
jgi:hypothetical protein